MAMSQTLALTSPTRSRSHFLRDVDCSSTDRTAVSDEVNALFQLTLRNSVFGLRSSSGIVTRELNVSEAGFVSVLK
jgi:hypothetical protein